MAAIVPVAIGLAFTGLSYIINRPKNQRNVVEGQKINTDTPNAEYGYGLDIFYGKCKKSGCSLIWALPLKEEQTTTTETQRQGKGGGGRATTETTTYSYYLTAAYAIGAEITDVQRIWASGKLIYGKEDGSEISATVIDHSETFYGSHSQPSSVIQANESETVPVFKGMSYIVFENLPVAIFDQQGFPSIDIEIVGILMQPQEYCYVADIIKDLCLRSGLTEDEIDVSELYGSEDTWVRGFTLKSGTSYRSAIEDLQKMFFIVIQETKNKIYFLPQKRLFPSAIILERYLQSSDGESSEYYIQKMLNAEEIPSSINLTFTNLANNLEQDSVTSYNPIYTHANTMEVSTNIITYAWKAREIIDRWLYEYEAQNITIEKIFLLPAWMCLRVGDTFAIIKEGETDFSQLWQVTKRNRGNNYLLEYEAIKFRGVIESSDGFISNINQIDVSNPVYTESDQGTYTPEVSAGNYGTAEVIAIDTSLISDNDIDFTIYNAVKPLDEDWQNGALYYSVDSVNYSYYLPITNYSRTGTVSTALSDHCTSLIDTINIIRVVMANTSMTLSPVTESDFWQGKALLYLGGEIIAYRDVVLVSNNPLTYDISYLLRGRRGTEYYTDQHQANEELIILTGYLIESIGSQNDINKTFSFKAVATGQTEANVLDIETITVTGNSAKPYPPMPVNAVKVGNNWLITWYRRTKRYGQLRDYLDIAFDTGELDSYRLEILNGGSVARAETINSIESFTYTEAMQISDFGSVQTTLRVRVRQLSSYPIGLNNARVFVF